MSTYVALHFNAPGHGHKIFVRPNTTEGVQALSAYLNRNCTVHMLDDSDVVSGEATLHRVEEQLYNGTYTKL